MMGQKRQQSIPTGLVLSLWLIAKTLAKWIYHVAGLDMIRPYQNAPKVKDLEAKGRLGVLTVLSTTSNVEQVYIYI